jgi:hypothetical protein
MQAEIKQSDLSSVAVLENIAFIPHADLWKRKAEWGGLDMIPEVSQLTSSLFCYFYSFEVPGLCWTSSPQTRYITQLSAQSMRNLAPESTKAISFE